VTLDTLKANNAANGHYWFSPDTMRFFRRRVSERLYRAADGAVYFVSSERNPLAARRYTVRVTRDAGATIDTVGQFQSYSNARTAHAAARHFARGK